MLSQFSGKVYTMKMNKHSVKRLLEKHRSGDRYKETLPLLNFPWNTVRSIIMTRESTAVKLELKN